MKKLALTTLAKEDIANCRETGKKRTLKKIAEILERLAADEPDTTIQETAATGEATNEKEEIVAELKGTEIAVMYCPVGRKYRIVYASTPNVVIILALLEKEDMKKKYL